MLVSAERKPSWQMDEESAESSPGNFQHLLNRAEWGGGKVRDELQDYVVKYMYSAEGVLPIDEAGFLKKGNHPAGVGRQYIATTGRIESCLVCVFMVYISPNGRALLNRGHYGLA